jgi:hypothetical protein
MKKGKLENASLVRGTGEAGCATLLFHNSISSHGGLSCHQHREGRLCNTAAQQGQYGTQIHGWANTEEHDRQAVQQCSIARDA